MFRQRNVVHYISEHVDRFSPASTTRYLIVSTDQRGTTTCGDMLGGMLLCDITVRSEQVTCPKCLEAPRYPLDVLKNTDL